MSARVLLPWLVAAAIAYRWSLAGSLVFWAAALWVLLGSGALRHFVVEPSPGSLLVAVALNGASGALLLEGLR